MATMQETRRTNGRADRRSGLIARVVDAWKRWRLFHRTRRELHQLSDRELDEMGLSRAMISRLAAETAYGK